MAEFERSLIQERVKAGLRNARAKGKQLGRPRTGGNETQVADLRHLGFAKKLGIGLGTAHRLAGVRT
jgi:DNA invertase Pin-like site-specific DNA recombinase